MKFTSFVSRRGSLALVTSLLVCGRAGAQETFTLKFQESGVREKFTGYRPHSVALSAEVPAEIKKAPAGLASPQYGKIKIGPAAAPAIISVILDQAEGKPTRLYVDTNANGDLTDEPAHDWTEKKFKRPDGTEVTSYFSDANVQIPFASGPKNAHLKFYWVEAVRAGEKMVVLGYFGDYGYVGEVVIDGKKIPAVLDDAGCTGDLHLSNNVMSNPLMWLDLNGNGKMDMNEMVVGPRPFQVDGKWWAMANLTPECSFQIVPSAKPELPKHEGPDLSPGHKAPAFTAKRTDGTTVKFPDDYKGKVVLLDFWATWCGPCVAELPNVVKAYEKFHPQGMEILGISLDRENAGQKLADFTKEHAMPWPQVFDGKYWQAEVAKLYGIDSIPHMVLVDGDTGVILADKDIRGEALAPAIEKGLAGKKQPN